MAAVNAPQPDAPAGNCAEVFDSTIVPSSGQVSQDQLPGPNNNEAPVHTGEVNMIDVFFKIQFMALTSFIWDTSNSVGQLLWYIPIHPSFVHQFMAHIGKMYNAFAGGFDFALCIAGTGFHAGKLVIVRLPPNIHPSSLKTMPNITAFPFFTMDPKTLETVVKSAMDQRNIMYHYMPYDANNINSFGGWLAVYVMLPLNTSATGATQISVQVFSKPAQDFQFSQIRPINDSVVNPFKPTMLEISMDLRIIRESPLYKADVESLIVYAPASKKEFREEGVNCVKLDKSKVQPETFPRVSQTVKFSVSQFNVKTMKSIGIETKEIFEETTIEKAVGFTIVNGDKYILSFDEIYKSSAQTEKYPLFYCKKVRWGIGFEWKNQEQVFMFEGELRPRAGDDPNGTREIVLQWTAELSDWVYMICGSDDCFPKQFLDNLIRNGYVQHIYIEYLAPLSFVSPMTPYAPPLNESFMMFHIGGEVDCIQTESMKQAILSEDMGATIGPQNSLIFELIDNQVNLPLMPVRLHYDGYLTVPATKNNVVFKMQDPLRYSFAFVGIIPETTPMTGSKLLDRTNAQYSYNMAVSKISSSLA